MDKHRSSLKTSESPGIRLEIEKLTIGEIIDISEYNSQHIVQLRSRNCPVSNEAHKEIWIQFDHQNICRVLYNTQSRAVPGHTCGVIIKHIDIAATGNRPASVHKKRDGFFGGRKYCFSV